MPPKHLDLNLQLQARKITIEGHAAEPNGFFLNGSFHAQISALKDRAHQKEKFALPLIYSAQNLNALEEAAQMNSRVTYPFIVLSGRGLENISPGAAFTRHVSMNRPADARRVLETAITKRPELQTTIADILEGDLPEGIKMLMVALRQKCLSHYLSNFCTAEYTGHIHRDINPKYHTGDFLQEEFNAWLYPNFSRFYYNDHIGNYYHQHQLGSERYHPIANRRRSQVRRRVRPLIKGKSRYASDVLQVTAALKDPAIPPTGLFALADWEEFTAITGDRRLTRALSLDIINWVRSAPADPFMAEALHRVVRQTGSLSENSPLNSCIKNFQIPIGLRKRLIGGHLAVEHSTYSTAPLKRPSTRSTRPELRKRGAVSLSKIVLCTDSTETGIRMITYT